ncbi:hypothetical protein E2C01_059031 [Portunus trituberculatus]|uniref:Uncharacterized protein n=1 Tax=Portunus trituberculatus TaxID=210409 RepID=A0A5B7H4Z8_PORTR|nr:hypothetical protein [Portunus trituberculatus]
MTGKVETNMLYPERCCRISTLTAAGSQPISSAAPSTSPALEEPCQPAEGPQKKRKADKSQWQKVVAKKRRDSGLEYVRLAKKKVVAARKVGEPCECPKVCFTMLGDHTVQEIFSGYWKMADSKPQSAYLSKAVISREDLFKEWCAEKDVPAEKIMRFDRYSRAFSRFNIGSRPPMVATCSYCDKIANEVEVATVNRDETKKSQLLTHKKVHLLKAKVARDLMTAYKQDTNSTLFAFAMDLQQTLVTPRLSTNVAYYKRKMWTYNFGVHNLKETTPATLYVWNESLAKRATWRTSFVGGRFTDHYVELMREARREHPFNVVQMTGEQFVDLQPLQSKCTKTQVAKSS